MKYRSIVFLLIAALLLCGCSAPQKAPVIGPSVSEEPIVVEPSKPSISAEPDVPAPGPITIQLTDLSGSRISIAGAPQKVVSLDPCATEMFYLLGAQDILIGRSAACDYPAETGSVPVMNTVEEVIAAEPELVFVDYRDTDTKQQLEAAGLTVVCACGNAYEDTFSGLALIAQITGRDATEQIQTLQMDLQAVADRGENLMEQSVVVVLAYSEDALTIAGANSRTAWLLEVSRGSLLTLEGAEDAEPVANFDQLLHLDPQVLLVSSACDLAPFFDEGNPLSTLSAVMEGRVFQVDDALLTRSGPRMVDAASAIYDALEQAELA